MPRYRVTDKKTGKSVIIEQERPPTSGDVKKTFEGNFAARNAPMIGELAGGFLGPVGSGLGFSIGHSTKNILDQVRNIGPAGGKGAQLTDFGKQRLQETGQQVPQNDFSYLKQVGKNVTNPENLKAAGKFLGQNIGGSAAAFGTDLALGGFGSEAKYLKKLMDSSPVLKAVGSLPAPKGKVLSEIKGVIPSIMDKGLGKIRGIKPDTVVKNAKQLKKEIFQPILNATDAAGLDRNIPVDDIVQTLNDRITDARKFTEDLPLDKLTPAKQDSIKALEAVRDELINESIDGKINLGQIVDLASEQGKKAFSPVTGAPRYSTNAGVQSEITGRKIMGSMLGDKRTQELVNSGIPEKEVNQIFKDYGKVSKLARDIEKNPLGGTFTAAFLNMLAGKTGVGLPPQLSALGTLGIMPWGQQLLREILVRPALGVADIGQRAGVSSLLNELTSGSKQ